MVGITNINVILILNTIKAKFLSTYYGVDLFLAAEATHSFSPCENARRRGLSPFNRREPEHGV